MLDGTTATYRVTEQLIVEPSALWITDQEPGHTLTIFACHPKGSARQRIVVRGQLAEPELAEPGVKPPAG
jgi:sortase (surface protein transpeptidase)